MGKAGQSVLVAQGPEAGPDDPDILRAEIDHLRRELARKDLLLRAALHRARSTSGSITSLISLQMREMRDPAVRAALELTRSRIAAMGRAHRLVSDSGDGKSLDLGRLLRDLVGALAEALEAAERRIAIQVTTDAPDILTSAAIPLALIANELIGNALRYAFRDRRSGRVQVALRVDGGRLTLSVRDDGIGISDKTLALGSSGLFLVRSLAADLGARLDILRDEGTLITLTMAADRAV